MEPPYQENQENQLWKKTGLDSAKSKILTESKFPNFPVTNFQNQQNQLSKRTGLTSLDLGQNLGPEQPELGPKLGPGPPYQENPKKKLRKRGRRLGPKLKRSKGLLAKSEFSKTKIWP